MGTGREVKFSQAECTLTYTGVTVWGMVYGMVYGVQVCVRSHTAFVGLTVVGPVVVVVAAVVE